MQTFKKLDNIFIPIRLDKKSLDLMKLHVGENVKKRQLLYIAKGSINSFHWFQGKCLNL